MRPDLTKLNYIYFLIDETDGKIKYIGMTNNPEIRYGMHLGNKDIAKNCPKYKWMVNLLKKNKPPTMLLVAKFEDRDECKEIEKHLIWEFSLTIKLFNTNYIYRPTATKSRIKRLSVLV